MKKPADNFRPPAETIPEGLEYKQEYWDGALAMIRQREKAVLWRRVAAGAIVLLALSGSAWWYYGSDATGVRLTDSDFEQVGSIYDRGHNIGQDNLETITGESKGASSEEGQFAQSGSGTQPTLRQDGPDTTPGSARGREDDGPAHTASSDDAAHAVATDTGEAHPPTAAQDADGSAQSGDAEIPSLDETLASTPLENTGTSSVRGTSEEAAGETGTGAVTPQPENPAQSSEGLALDDGSVSHPPVPLNEDSVITMRVEPPVPVVSDGLHDVAELETHEAVVIDHLVDVPFVMQPLPALSLSEMSGVVTNEGVVPQGISQALFGNRIPVRPFEANFFLGSNALADFGSRPGSTDLNLSIGVTGVWNINQAWNVQMGAEYFSVANISPVVVRKIIDNESLSEENHFETETTEEHYNTERLHYVSLPLVIGHRFHPRHQLLWATGLDILTQARQRIVAFPNAGGEEPGTSPYTKGYLTGYRFVSPFIGMGYEYKLNAWTSVGMRWQYGLRDITNPTLPEPTAENELPLSWRNEGDDRNSRALFYVRINVR